MLKRFCRCLFLITALAALLAGCSHRTGKAADPDLTLQVALYPYVPDPEGFRAADVRGGAKDAQTPDYPETSCKCSHSVLKSEMLVLRRCRIR